MQIGRPISLGHESRGRLPTELGLALDQVRGFFSYHDWWGHSYCRAQETMGVGFIGAFVVAGAVASLITMGVYMKKLNDAQADLAANHAQLAEEDKQVTVGQG
jgi:hypothetical protein